MRINNSIISQNVTNGNGGGMYLHGILEHRPIRHPSLSMKASSRATKLAATAESLLIGPSTNVTVKASTVSRNMAGERGGGIVAREARSFVVTESTISGNRGTLGGGLASLNSRAIVNQSTFYGNVAMRNGGGLFFESSGVEESVVEHTTISQNNVNARGGGIFISTEAGSAHSVQLDSTIVSENIGPADFGTDEIFDQGASTGISGLLSARFSLIQNNEGTNLLPGIQTRTGI